MRSRGESRLGRTILGVAVAVVIAAAVMLLVFLMLERIAHAHIKDHPELDAWMNGLQSKGGYPCCSYAEATVIDDAEWDTAVVNGENRYRVRIGGNWIVVSPEEVVEGPNNAKVALAWIYRDSVGVPNVRCFMPGGGT
jgi:hypothetical protein